MAVIGTYTQQPNDILDYDIPYDLVAGDSLSSATTSVSPTTTPPLAVAPTFSASTLKLWVSGGVAGTAYKITFVVQTTLGRKKEDEIKIRVKDY